MINLLPIPEKNTIRKEYRLRVLVACLVALSFALGVAIVSFVPFYILSFSRYETFLSESKSDETQGRISQVKEMEATITETNQKIDALKAGAMTLRVKDLVLVILKSKTEGVTLTAFSYDFGGATSKKGKEETTSAPTIAVRGKSSSRTALIAFKDALAQKKEFTAVDLPVSNLVKDTDLDFSINLSVATAMAQR